MEEILHQLIGSFSHYLQGFIHSIRVPMSAKSRPSSSSKKTSSFELEKKQQVEIHQTSPISSAGGLAWGTQADFGYKPRVRKPQQPQ